MVGETDCTIPGPFRCLPGESRRLDRDAWRAKPSRPRLLLISDGLTKCETGTSRCKRRLANLQSMLGSPLKPNSQMEMKSRAFSKLQNLINLTCLLLACPNTIRSSATPHKKLPSASRVRYWESGRHRFQGGRYASVGFLPWPVSDQPTILVCEQSNELINFPFNLNLLCSCHLNDGSHPPQRSEG
jgi:hypothetical protein